MGSTMAKRCEICGRGALTGNNVSHAHNITRRRWNVNLQRVRVKVNGVQKRIRVCTACIRAGRVQKVT
jgi:large subunit ribosomal protein L28